MNQPYDAVQCPDCKNWVPVFESASGEETGRIFRLHNDSSGNICPQSNQPIPPDVPQETMTHFTLSLENHQ